VYYAWSVRIAVAVFGAMLAFYFETTWEGVAKLALRIVASAVVAVIVGAGLGLVAAYVDYSERKEHAIGSRGPTNKSLNIIFIVGLIVGFIGAFAYRNAISP